MALHDVLRYTLVFPREGYTAAVKTVERELMDSGLVARIFYKNYWTHEDLTTTYMGLNSQVS